MKTKSEEVSPSNEGMNTKQQLCQLDQFNLKPLANAAEGGALRKCPVDIFSERASL